jgi:hypothetical protein
LFCEPEQLETAELDDIATRYLQLHLQMLTKRIYAVTADMAG